MTPMAPNESNPSGHLDAREELADAIIAFQEKMKEVEKLQCLLREMLRYENEVDISGHSSRKSELLRRLDREFELRLRERQLGELEQRMHSARSVFFAPLSQPRERS